MNQYIIILFAIGLIFVSIYKVIKFFQARQKPISADQVTEKFGILWDKKWKPYCKHCLNQLEPHLFDGINSHYYPIYEIGCVHCNGTNKLIHNGERIEYEKVLEHIFSEM